MSSAAVLSPTIGRRPRRVVLAGNPNVGKSSLFNALTGLRQRVGNYPGVTVERVAGTMSTPAGSATVLDLPGTYSLHPRSPDEEIARDEILGALGEGVPDVVVVVVDASAVERSLFLASQIIETGRPVIVALNQVDVALADGIEVDAGKLSEALGVPVIATCGRSGAGCDELRSQIAQGGSKGRPLELVFDAAVEQAAASVRADLNGALGDVSDVRLRRLLCSAGAMHDLETGQDDVPDRTSAVARLRQERTRLAEAGIDVATLAAQSRYRAVAGIVAQTSVDVKERSPWQHRLDGLLTHPVLGLGVLIGIFLFLFLVVFSWSGPAIDFVDETLGTFGEWFGALFGTGLLADFAQNGVVAGLGAFLVFVPQIAMLFVCIEALDDSGYLTRAAFLLDRLMGKVGLPGRALLPLVSGFACAIPGVMATRAISSRRERFLTIAILPLMSCQARLPVYAVIVGALFTQFGGWVGPVVVLSMYMLGIVTALAGAKVLKLTMLQGQRSPLMLELPPYRRPSTRTVLKNTARRTWSFVAGAGPIILAFSMLLWASLAFPRDVEYSRDFDAEIAALETRAEQLPADLGEDAPARVALEEETDELRGLESAERLAHSWMGRAGKLIEPGIEPLGFDWKIGIAIIGSFAAREVFVPTLGVTYAAGDDADEESEGLLQSMRNDRWPDGRRVFTPLVGISLLVFYVIALQCMSTLAVIKRETNSWRWPVWLFVGYTMLAYVASLAVFQIGTALGY